MVIEGQASAHPLAGGGRLGQTPRVIAKQGHDLGHHIIAAVGEADGVTEQRLGRPEAVGDDRRTAQGRLPQA